MIFPWGISLSPTLSLLKAYNFSTTVNAQYHPYLFLEGDYSSNFDFNMRPANMNFGNFPVVSRKHPCSSYEPHVFNTNWWLFQLFVDKPLLLYSHHNQIFNLGADGFNAAADMINGITGNTEWKSLGEIAKRMYLQKANDDGTISVFMYTNDLILSNETDSTLIYEVQKIESLNVPILDLTADDVSTAYSFTDTTLRFTVTIPPNSSKEIEIIYSSGDKDFAISASDIYFDPQVSDTLTVTVHNYGTDGGPVPIQFFDGHPDSGGTALDLVTIEWIDPNDSTVIKTQLNELAPEIHSLYIILDPHDVIYESNEENNWATTDIASQVPNSAGPMPDAFSLFANYPNPFNCGTTLTYHLSGEDDVKLSIYNVRGQRVVTLVDDTQPVGAHQLTWDGRNDHGLPVASGVYFCALKVGHSKKVQKMVLLR